MHDAYMQPLRFRSTLFLNVRCLVVAQGYRYLVLYTPRGFWWTTDTEEIGLDGPLA